MAFLFEFIIYLHNIEYKNSFNKKTKFTYMKTKIITLIFMALSLSLYSQNGNISYLDFFGKKYDFKNSIIQTESKYLIESKKETIKYTLCGKQFLNQKVTKHMSQSNMNFFIKKSVYSISNCVNFYNLVDSVNISKLDKKLDFKVVSGNNNYRILGFKIVADSIDYEIIFTETNDRTLCNWDFDDSLDNKVTYKTLDNKEFKNFMMYDAVSNEAKKQLISIFDELKNCSRLMLTGMYYFDKKNNREYFISMDILLYK
ncbi:MAG: hypothetical protein A2046_07800 [Bacteroidetes bacterium GWA2_30_7]|nr:MAG: hypothetical protein A2046_07800 [Bacteroidetes bacterium GWA2_30_7]